MECPLIKLYIRNLGANLKIPHFQKMQNIETNQKVYIFTFVRTTKFGLPKSKGQEFINAFSLFCLTLYITYQVRCTLILQLL